LTILKMRETHDSLARKVLYILSFPTSTNTLLTGWNSIRQRRYNEQNISSRRNLFRKIGCYSPVQRVVIWSSGNADLLNYFEFIFIKNFVSL
ncbi:MAG: hypothetical protein JXI43_13125, partial [Tissierellales bacterium]|nr:hypothetical protein [Tissierellales bacterium]